MNKDLLQRIWFISLLAALASHFLHPKVQAPIILLFALCSTFLILQDFAWFKSKVNLGITSLYSLMFIVLIIGSIGVENTSLAMAHVERNISFIAVPVSLVLATRLNIKQQKALFYIFQFCVLITGMMFLANATYNSILAGGTSSLNNDPLFQYNFFMSHLLTDPFGIHPIYHSLLVSLGGISLLVYLHQQWNSLDTAIRVFWVGLFLFDVVLIYLLKSALFSILFIVSIAATMLVLNFSKLKTNRKMTIATLAGIFLLGFVGVSNFLIKVETLDLKVDYTSTQLKPIQLRLGIWSNSAEVASENWLKGVGTGNSQKALNEKYRSNGFEFMRASNKEYNAHNQFLQFTIENGLAMALLFAILLVVLSHHYYRQKNISATLFILCFVLFSLNESTLQTQRGILIFTFFSPLFLYCPQLWNFGSNENTDPD